jgi:uncharacterized protein (DUF342 family)
MAGTVIKGAVSIEIDLLEIDVSLRFVPDKSGEDWSAERIIQILGEKRVSPLPSARIVDELFQKLAKAKEKQTVSLVKGAPAEPPQPERIIWADLPIPEDLKAIAGTAIDSAGPPKLFRVVVDKIKHETIVKKPSPIPFMPPKEEVVVTWEKKETREPVFVEPTVLDTAYAEKGQKIGTLQARKPGKPGKSVFGKPVQPPADTGGDFHTADTIERDKNEVKALISGVLRIGANWADLVPLVRPAWNVEKSPDGASILLSYEPGTKGLPSPNATDILAVAIGLGVKAEDLCTAEELEKEIGRATQTGMAIKSFSLSRRKDAEALVDLGTDKQKAILFLRKGTGGGAPLELKAISEAIKTSGVRGFSAEKVKTDILTFFKGPETVLADYLLVEGKAPTRGKDREVLVTAAFLAEKERIALAERVASSSRSGLPMEHPGFFLPLEATGVALVEKDVKIAAVTRPPPGSPGNDIFGNNLPGLPGNDPLIQLCAGLRMSKDDIFTDTAGALFNKKTDTAYSAYVVPYKDSSISVNITPDTMSATIELEKESGGGIPLSAEAVNKAITSAGVIRGVDGMAVAEALGQAFEHGSCPAMIIARGEPPVASGTSEMKWFVQKPTGKGVTLRENGRADFKNQDRFLTISEGIPIAEIVKQSEAGKSGWDVTGKELPADKGQAIEFTHDDSIREEPTETGVRLIAGKTGELVIDGTALAINALHGVKGDVGPGTGNINFPGEVRIGGGILPGYAVVGGGDVLIAGAVEAALVSAGGKALISLGVIGSGKGIVRARQTIEASFVEKATLLAVGDIRIKNGCMQSQVKTNGKLRLLGDKGYLIGGVCRARAGVEAMNVGTERGTRTEISFGQDYLVKDQIEVSERELDRIKTALTETEKKIQAAVGSPFSLDNARAEKVKLMKLMEKHGMQLFTLREKFEEHHESEVRVRGNVFPGVVLESHGRYLEIKQKKGQVVFYFDREVGRILDKALK